MKNFFKTIIYFTIFTMAIGFLGINPIFMSHATGESQKTIFMISPDNIVATSSGVFVYDSSDQSIKRIDRTSANSISYYSGEIIDMSTDGDNIYILKSGQVEILDASTLPDSPDIETLEYDWLTDSYSHVGVANINNKTMLYIYGDTIETTIKCLTKNGDNWLMKDYLITPSTTDAAISKLSFAEFASNTYLIKVDANHVTFYELGDEQSLSRNTPITDIRSDVDILDVYYFDSKLLVVYNDFSSLYALQNNISSIGADEEDSISHIYGADDSFEAKKASYNDGKLYLLSTDCYYVLSSVTMTFVDKMSNALCVQSYISNKSQYKYHKLLADTNIISTLGSASTIPATESNYVVEIATSTLSDGTALVGYKYVMYVELYQDSENVWHYKNHYGYIEDDAALLEEIQTPSTLEIVTVDNNTKMYEYPSVELDDETLSHPNKPVYYISKPTPVNVISYLGEYKTGAESQEHEVSYALVESNGHVGFIDISHINAADKRVINTLPNAKITAQTPVYEQADTESDVISTLESGKNVRIIGRRDSNGFIKIAYNNDLGYYYEGYVKAYNVRSNSFTTLQIIGTVLVVLNVVLLVVLIATRRKITKA